MYFNLLLGSLKVSGGVCVLLNLIVNGTQVSDLLQCQLNMLLYMHSVLVSMFIMFPIIKLRNYMVPGQNKPQTFNYY